MIYRMNEAGVRALKKLASSLDEQVKAIKQATIALDVELNSNRSGLGPHVASLEGVVDAMNEEVQSASSPISELSEKVYALATKYDDFIYDDPYGSSGN